MPSDPRVVFGDVAAGTARTDRRVKLEEYKDLPSVDTIVLVEIASEWRRIVQRAGRNGWNDVDHDGPPAVTLPSITAVLSHPDIFARD